MPAPEEGLDLLKALADNPLLTYAPDERPEAGIAFDLQSDFRPSGDQPQAIAELVEGVQSGARDQVLLGRHRLGQDLHHGARHRAGAEADADPGAQQDPGGAALRRDQVVLPEQRRRVFRHLLRLLSARGLRPAHRHLHREDLGDQRADRPHAPLGDPGAARARRRDHRRLGVLHLRHRLARDLRQDGPEPAPGPAGRARSACCAPWSSCSTSATTSTSTAAPSARAATRSRSSRPISRTAPGACRCSATRSRRSSSSIR